ncbi:aldehyde dehydrogenase family protein [Aliarcobacter skirrowii]|nr:aldehyde dehydrogenase family protein [Aliarcobacter skirrowii]
MPRSNEKDVDLAVEAPKKGFEEFKHTSVTQRSALLNKIADIVEANLETLAVAEMYQKGLDVKQDYIKAVYWYEKSDISIESSQNLGDMYYYGTGVKQDYKKAIETYKKVDSCHNYYNLGIMYYKGEGTKVDKEKSYKYWTSCAKSSNKEMAKKIKEKLDILCKENQEICINKR